MIVNLFSRLQNDLNDVILVSLWLTLTIANQSIVFILNLQHCIVLRDLVPLCSLKSVKKHPWRIVTFIKVAG